MSRDLITHAVPLPRINEQMFGSLCGGPAVDYRDTLSVAPSVAVTRAGIVGISPKRPNTIRPQNRSHPLVWHTGRAAALTAGGSHDDRDTVPGSRGLG
jgi:hypothetical protein